jgi:hypothetical protein
MNNMSVSGSSSETLSRPIEIYQYHSKIDPTNKWGRLCKILTTTKTYSPASINNICSLNLKRKHSLTGIQGTIAYCNFIKEE